MLGRMREIEKFADVDSSDNNSRVHLHLRGKDFPRKRTAGAIPLSSSAVAARTARTKQAELFNDFTQLLHFSIFELVKLGDTGLDAQVIQKLMSAPVLASSGRVIGVIQVSRTAPPSRGRAAGFTPDDLRRLESVALFVDGLMAKGRAIAQATKG